MAREPKGLLFCNPVGTTVSESPVLMLYALVILPDRLTTGLHKNCPLAAVEVRECAGETVWGKGINLNI